MNFRGTERKFNIFLFFLMISLVGNSCADFGFIWYAVAHLPAHVGDASNKLSEAGLLPSFYFGQAIGNIVLAPILSVIADRYTKRMVSLVTDSLYAAFLVGILTINMMGDLQPRVLFMFSLVTSTLGVIHRNFVGFGALKTLSDKVKVTSLVAKFNAVYFTVYLIGSALAGALYRYSGLNICLVLAILSFLPMPFIYFQIFQKQVCSQQTERRNIIREIKEGVSFILGDRILIINAICVTFWFVSANLFPALVGIAFQRVAPGRTDVASYAVSGCILVGIISFYPLQNISDKLSIRLAISFALLPAAIVIGLCTIYPSPWLFTAGYLANSIGAALLNIVSSGARVKRVPERLLGRVNTAHTAMVSIGQVAGSLWLIPLATNSLETGAAVIAISLIFSSMVAAVFMPKQLIRDAI